MQLATIESPKQLTQIIQSLVAGSFAKKFATMDIREITNAFAFVSQDLTQEQMRTGILTLLDKGFCPDPALFRRWCLGQSDFTNSDTVANGYIGKHGALNAIIKWQADPHKTPITIAQKQAYDETCDLWHSIHSSGDQLRAELAFKDCYEHIVSRLVEQRTPCAIYVAPPALAQPLGKQNAKDWRNDPASVAAADLAAKTTLESIKAMIADAKSKQAKKHAHAARPTNHIADALASLTQTQAANAAPAH